MYHLEPTGQSGTGWPAGNTDIVPLLNQLRSIAYRSANAYYTNLVLAG